MNTSFFVHTYNKKMDNKKEYETFETFMSNLRNTYDAISEVPHKDATTRQMWNFGKRILKGSKDENNSNIPKEETLDDMLSKGGDPTTIQTQGNTSSTGEHTHTHTLPNGSTSVFTHNHDYKKNR